MSGCREAKGQDILDIGHSENESKVLVSTRVKPSCVPDSGPSENQIQQAVRTIDGV